MLGKRASTSRKILPSTLTNLDGNASSTVPRHPCPVKSLDRILLNFYVSMFVSDHMIIPCCITSESLESVHTACLELHQFLPRRMPQLHRHCAAMELIQRNFSVGIPCTNYPYERTFYHGVKHH